MEIDTSYTDCPICPYCGEKEEDAWEIDFGIGLDGDVTINCGTCDKEYFISRHVSVSYSTKKLK